MMRSPAIDENVMPVELKAYLAKCGLAKQVINKCTLETRLYHDLGIYGDIAEAFMEVLADSYKVDLANFAFYKYFPAEFDGNSWLARFLTTYIPWGKRLYQKSHVYAPLTLKMLLGAISNGKFE
jgi:hypothetical protein